MWVVDTVLSAAAGGGDGVQVFEVDVHRLSIESSANCSGDHVQLFDGDGDSPLSAPLCGDEPPSETFVGRTSVLVVQFRSDRGGADAGFVLGYVVVVDDDESLDEVDVDDDAPPPPATGQRGS